MMINMRCPNCGANISYDPARPFMFCQYCGTKITGNGQIQPRTISDAPNLTINYSTTSPAYELAVEFNGERWVFPNNSSKAFTLRPGIYAMTFYIARRGWKRNIVIPQSGSPVTVNVVYAGRTKIYIQ